MIKNIHLYGTLAEKYGSGTITLAAGNASMLFSGLKWKYPDFTSTMSEFESWYVVATDDNKTPIAITEKTWDQPFGNATDIHIMPAIQGAGLEFAAFATWAGSALAEISITKILVNMALSYVVSAIASALTPTPKVDSTQSESVESKPSFIFSRPENSVEEGHCVQLVYGQFLAGSVVIAAGYNTERISV